MLAWVKIGAGGLILGILLGTGIGIKGAKFIWSPKVEKLKAEVSQLTTERDAQIRGVQDRDRVIVELRGAIDSTNLIVSQLEEKAKKLAELRLAEKARWESERITLDRKLKDALTNPLPGECIDAVREAARRVK